MQRFIVLRIGQGLIALFAVSIIVFSLTRLTGSPADVFLSVDATQEDYDRIAEQWGLNDPLYQQYLVFLFNVLRGDLGDSWRWPGHTAFELTIQRSIATLQLALFSLSVSTVIAVPIGVMAAVNKDRPIDWVGKVIALLGQSVPPFWMGLVLIWIFAVQLEWLPTSGRGSFKHIIMPAITMGWFQVAAVMRLMRSSMLDSLDTEYVKLARIKGLTERKVVWKHALKNAAITPLTYFGIIAASFLTGSVVVETVFAWPGIGSLAIEAVRSQDYTVIQAVVVLFAGVFIFASLVVDILYAYLDPRIRYQ